MAGTQAKKDIIKDFEALHKKLSSLRKEISKTVIGQDKVIEQTLITLISGGHALLVGVPGLAKTLLVETIAKTTGMHANRIQCTPDLMPADIIGSEVLEETAKGKRSFRFIPGPVFCEFLMADEINRASPRTQSALLQAMQEREVSVSGQPYALPSPFHVLATQNPIEQEGTYPLPEAQLDRFMIQIMVDYPDLESERQIIIETTKSSTSPIKKVIDKQDLLDAQMLVKDMPIGENVVECILELVRALRPGETSSDIVNNFVTWAPGPRGSQNLILATRAKALLDGRTAPVIGDVIDLAVPVLRHRMALNYKARAENITIEDVIKSITETF
ncbi:MAG: MoxR family ATPase [Alphaproteobacteria bacterium]|nr:MoxR family ATPase [Alphaproteobacteria bacterium]